MFIKGNRYRHISTLDIDIQIQSDPEDSDDCVKFIAAYYNRNMQMYQGEPEELYVKKTAFGNWVLVCEDKL